MANVLCVDIGFSRCKLGLVDWVAGSMSQHPAVPSPPFFFESNGYSSFCRHLRTTAVSDRTYGPEGLALAVPFAVDYRAGVVVSLCLGGWPDSLSDFLTTLDEQLGLTALVLNDAVAFALGCPELEHESGPRAALYITLGTNFGCALMRNSSVVHSVEVNQHLANIGWPNGFRGSASALLHRYREQRVPDTSYSQLVGWVLGALQRDFSRVPVVLGGGGAGQIAQDEVTKGIEAVGGSEVRMTLQAADSVALFGAARFWSEVATRGRPVWELVGPMR